ncbi:MAG: Uma2 family endonuclease [Polyangiaceae bacterium]|nr:Uma2 family endonuclease [Polyangiaceae bacterium]
MAVDPSPYLFDPNDPRAPSQSQWDRMSEAERAQVVENLPSEFPVRESAPPEGDPHFDAKANTRQTLRSYFERIGRKVYIVCELPIYYPGEEMFAPDVSAILDVELHPRMSWVVSAEKKGIDLAIEIHVAGDRRKDLEKNVERYARLGIKEYFIFDRGRLDLVGYRLAGTARAYQRIVPQHGFYPSNVLGLQLRVEETRLRFFHGTAPILEADEMIERLEKMVLDVETHQQEKQRALEEAERQRIEAERAREEERRAREEERRAREEAERKLAEALAEIERLRRER